MKPLHKHTAYFGKDSIKLLSKYRKVIHGICHEGFESHSEHWVVTSVEFGYKNATKYGKKIGFKDHYHGTGITLQKAIKDMVKQIKDDGYRAK